jgi:hypothetical protein
MPTRHRSGPPRPETIEDFSRKAHEYLEHISDPAAKRFTLRYIEFLQSKAHGISTTEPAGECGVSMLDCRLIRSVLRNIYKDSLSKQIEAA